MAFVDDPLSVLINSFCIDDDDNVSARVGKGLYLEASVLDHSCWPNAVWVFSGKTLTVRAIEDIASFSDVRINYVAVESTKDQRHKYKHKAANRSVCLPSLPKKNGWPQKQKAKISNQPHNQ